MRALEYRLGRMRHFGHNDLYTYTVKRVVWERFSHLEVEYAFKNRDGTDLRPLIPRIREKIRELDGLAPSAPEIQKLRETGYMGEPFLEALGQFRLSADHVLVGERDGRFDLRIRGPWYQVIDLEVPALGIVNEAYFESLDSPALRQEGERRLDAKIERIRAVAREASETEGAFPFRIIEMGTRRAFSPDWQGRVLERLADGLPNVLLGTSNLYWGERLGLKLYGTFSHQGPMAMQTQAPIQDSQKAWFELWDEVYRGRLGIALSDTLGTPMFLRDFDLSLAKRFDGARQDSGDPFAWGETFIAHLASLGIDPRTKTAVFSDSLDDAKAAELWRRFAKRIRVQFGIGTFFSNDLGPRPLSNVIKLVRVGGYPVCKLGDDPAKAQADDEEYLRYVRHLVTDVMPKA